MRSLLAGLLLAASLVETSIAAEQTLDLTPDEIANVARGYGSSILDQLKNGQPVIFGKMDGQNYGIFLIGCEDKPSCALIQFTAQFPGDKVDLVKVNEWNRDKRFGKVSIAEDGKVWVNQAVVTGEGLPRKTIERYFGFWQLVLKQLPEFIAAK